MMLSSSACAAGLREQYVSCRCFALFLVAVGSSITLLLLLLLLLPARKQQHVAKAEDLPH
jgi:hypothetical protein